MRGKGPGFQFVVPGSWFTAVIKSRNQWFETRDQEPKCGLIQRCKGQELPESDLTGLPEPWVGPLVGGSLKDRLAFPVLEVAEFRDGGDAEFGILVVTGVSTEAGHVHPGLEAADGMDGGLPHQ